MLREGDYNSGATSVRGVMVGDGYSWIWNNPVTREVARCPKRVGDLVWGSNHHWVSMQGNSGLWFSLYCLRYLLTVIPL